WLMIALVTIWAGWKTTDDVHRIALVSMGLFFIVLFLISTPESMQLLFKFMFLMVLLLGRFVLRSSLYPQPQRYE
ncbi:MAG: hypothetical protein WBB43_24505, partial [Limnoraphis sp.]